MASKTIADLDAIIATAVAAGDLAPLWDLDAAVTKKIAADVQLDALLRIAAATGVLMLDATAGKLIIRQRGGTAGTDELQLYDDGTNSWVEGKNGGIMVKVPGYSTGNLRFASPDG